MSGKSILLQKVCRVISKQPSRASRRTTVPPRWVPQKYGAYAHQQITPENEEFLRRTVAVESPLKESPWPRGIWVPNSKRTGLLCKKIGMIPQWDNKGERMLCTLLEVLDNHVINYQDPHTWYRLSHIGKRKAFLTEFKFGKLTVGAIAADPQQFTAAYRGVFEKAGVMPKKKLASFMVTENAVIQPGTRLTAAHFKVGQCVDVSGRSIDWGFQGVMHRWGFRGQMYLWGQATKSHRRPGAIGTSGDGKVHLGKRLPGHMGWEWRHVRGLPIVRINLKEQVLYVKGAVPGDTSEIVQVKDSFVEGKEVQDPPFPTCYEDDELPDEWFMDGIHKMSDSTIVFPEGEGDYEAEIAKQLARAKIKKQAKAKRK